MAYAMTKQGSLDNCVTYEFICDAVEDMNAIEDRYRTIGTVAIVLSGESGLEVYIAGSNKQWNSLSSIGGSAASDTAGLSIYICAQDEVSEGVPDVELPDEQTLYLVPAAEPDSGNLYDEYIYVEGEWEKFGSGFIDVDGLPQADFEDEDNTSQSYIQNKPFTSTTERRYQRYKCTYPTTQELENQQKQYSFNLSYKPSPLEQSTITLDIELIFANDETRILTVPFEFDRTEQMDYIGTVFYYIANNIDIFDTITIMYYGAYSGGGISFITNTDLSSGFSVNIVKELSPLRKLNAPIDMSISLGPTAQATGLYSFVSGDNATASGERAHAEGNNAIASGDHAFAFGNNAQALGNYAYALGQNAEARYPNSIAIGRNVIAQGPQQVYGEYNALVNTPEWVPGQQYNVGDKVFNGDAIYVCREATSSTIFMTGQFGQWATDEALPFFVIGNGYQYQRSNIFRVFRTGVAEGTNTKASGTSSHAEGINTIASGPYSHAEGSGTTASGGYSHVEGSGTIAIEDNSHVFGKYNVAIRRLEIVGNGSNDNNRSNARSLDSNGNEYLKGNLYVQCNADSTGGTKVANEIDIAKKIDKSVKTQIFQPKEWNGMTSFNGEYIWIDGDNIYYSNAGQQWVFNNSNLTWEAKTWNGLTYFVRKYIWTDGTDIYYSDDNQQYILDRSTSTWNIKNWNGFTYLDGQYIWSDGTNIYYSYSDDQYILDKSTSTWTQKVWNGLTSFDGQYIWKDKTNIYYSAYGSQYILDESTSTWTPKTWGGVRFYGDTVWSDGVEIYISDAERYYKYILDPATSTWIQDTSIIVDDAKDVWTYGEHIYYSSASDQYQIVSEKQILIGENGEFSSMPVKTFMEENSPLPEAPSTDGTYILQATVTNGTPTYSWVSLPTSNIFIIDTSTT